MKKLRLCIGIPTYNGGQYLSETLASVFRQSYHYFSIVISDDCSTDNTIKIAQKFPGKKMRVYRNKENVGCSKNFQILKRYIRGDILFLLCQDDILLPGALERTVQAFQDKYVGAVTRPYYWFDRDLSVPVRVVLPMNKTNDESLFLLRAKKEKIIKVIESSGQASGLAFRIKDLKIDFHPEIFVTHVDPFLDIARRCKIVFLNDMTVAVRIASSQSRGVSGVYDRSPTKSWMDMFDRLFHGKKYMRVSIIGKEYMAQHFVGLIQIKNYSSTRNLIREMYYLLLYRRKNVLNPKFWFYAILALITPRFLLRTLTDQYKNVILSRLVKL